MGASLRPRDVGRLGLHLATSVGTAVLGRGCALWREHGEVQRDQCMIAAPTEIATRFTYEAEMIPAIAEAAARLVAGLPDADNHMTFFEVPSFESVPDVVIVQFEHAALDARLTAGAMPVVDPTKVRVLLALTNGITDLDELTTTAGLTRAHLRRAVLPDLASCGWVEPLASRSTDVELLVPFEPLLNWVVTVEAKRSKWRDAVAQARRHTVVATRAFVAIEAASATVIREHGADLAREGIGLATVDAVRHTTTVERMPHRRRRRTDEVARQLLGERVWQMELSGNRVGVTSHVFGQTLPSYVP